MSAIINYLQCYDRIKHVIGKHVKGKITNTDIAIAIKLKPNVFAQMRSRGVFPYEEVIQWCSNNNIDIYYILFDKGEGARYEYKI